MCQTFFILLGQVIFLLLCIIMHSRPTIENQWTNTKFVFKFNWQLYVITIQHPPALPPVKCSSLQIIHILFACYRCWQNINVSQIAQSSQFISPYFILTFELNLLLSILSAARCHLRVPFNNNNMIYDSLFILLSLFMLVLGILYI